MADSESEESQDAHSEVLADNSTDEQQCSGRWGTITLRTHCREVEAGYDTLMNRTTGDTFGITNCLTKASSAKSAS